MKWKIILAVVSIAILNISCTKPSRQEAARYSSDLVRIIDDIESAFVSLDNQINTVDNHLNKTPELLDSMINQAFGTVQKLEEKLSTSQRYLSSYKKFNGDDEPREKTLSLVKKIKEKLLPQYQVYFQVCHELFVDKRGSEQPSDEKTKKLIKISEDLIKVTLEYSDDINNYGDFITAWISKFKKI